MNTQHQHRRNITWGVSLLLMALIHLALNGQILKLSYERDALREKLSQVERERRVLEKRVAELESLPRIEKIARDQLGMTEPAKIKILTLPKSR